MQIMILLKGRVIEVSSLHEQSVGVAGVLVTLESTLDEISYMQISRTFNLI